MAFLARTRGARGVDCGQPTVAELETARAAAYGPREQSGEISRTGGSQTKQVPAVARGVAEGCFSYQIHWFGGIRS